MVLTSQTPNAPWLRTTPPDWLADRLKDIVPRILGGGTPPSSDPDCWEDGDIVWVTPTDFSRAENSSEIYDSERKITRMGLNSSAATLLPQGTVIMASRATIGTVRIAGTELTTNQGFISFVCDERKLHRRFLYYVISGFLGEYFAEIAPGTTFQEISRGKAKLEPIGYPPPPEQQRIAAYLDASCAAIDTAVAAKRRQLETLTALRKSIIQRAVTKGMNPGAEMRDSGSDDLGEIPSHWKTDRMKNVVALRNEKTNVASEEADYLELEDIESGTGCILNRRNTLEVESAVTLFKTGDILFGKLRPYLEKYVHAGFDGKCTGEILAFKPTRLKSRFLFYCIASPWFIGRCNALAYGAKMPRVNWQTQLAAFNLPIPPAEEQEAICSHLDVKLAEVKRIVTGIESQIATLTAYRKSLIHECVTGQRRISEMDINKVKAHG